MSYLARLKRLDGAKNFTHAPETVPTKLTQPGSVSSVSSIPAHIEKIHATNDGEKIDTESTSTAAEQIHDRDEAEAVAWHEDDRRRCAHCLNIRPGGVCKVAEPGGLVSAMKGYRPSQAVLQRCAGYRPCPDDPDRRPGRERWPGLLEDGAR